MPQMVSTGSSGPPVRTLQQALNDSPPTTLALLTVDGIFGPKTAARVREFQGGHGLSVDGIVGPLTWGELLVPVPDVPERGGCDCGNGAMESLTLAKSLQQDFLRAKAAATGPSTTTVSRTFLATGFGRPAGSTGTSGASALNLSNTPFRFLTTSQKNQAKAVYGNSLDFSRIFISNKTGLGNRPFTMAFPDENEIVQIMNCGTFTPKHDTLIHELAHVWQSQHHSDPFKFMSNAVQSQGRAVSANSAETFSDPDILLHKDHPVQFPFSAYAYVPGFGLSSYAAEQMANAIEHGDPKLVAHAKGIAMNAVDPDNVSALKRTLISDRRVKGVVF